MKNKPFDCVEMKRKAAAQIYDQIQGMSLEAELEFWQQYTDKLRQYQQRSQDQPLKKTNFSEMSVPDLRAYVLSHRDDLEAIRALFYHPSLIDKYQTMPPMFNPDGTPNEENIRFGEEALRRRIERDKDQETQ